ncbi:hypothetical protein [Clostridium sp. Marseille-P2415]|uniref:hypothetical protein n=1 Tax=Clostridium sp. Marseille-P2415 TaxID=1805471 RepID=UPI00098850C3|nr:hypothetical protein [Clostridium sp. Marseille-P2415]
MAHFTTNTYILKREILTFLNKISRKLSKPDRKFTADTTYGMLASGSCLLTDDWNELYVQSCNGFMKQSNIVESLNNYEFRDDGIYLNGAKITK